MVVHAADDQSGVYECTLELLDNYNAANSAVIDELHEEPSPVLFLRYVAKNRPFVIRGGCSAWQAVKKWNIQYMLEVMGNAEIDVAETPLG